MLGQREDEARFRDLIQAHHYLGAVPVVVSPSSWIEARRLFSHSPDIAGNPITGQCEKRRRASIQLEGETTTYPFVREWWDLRHVVRPVVATLGIAQYWTMFAPRPCTRDAWHLAPGLSRDGRVVELLSGRELRIRPPVDGPRHYGGVRWRTAVFRSIKRRETDRVLRYWCRTGRWDAVELWEFRRANLGMAATADLPYEATRLAFWECDGADLARVEAFTDDVVRRMEAYSQSVTASGRESTSAP